MAETKRPKRKNKIRLRSKLPSNMPALDWVEMVLDQKPVRNVLGAMVFYEGQLCVVAWLGRKVHCLPYDQARPGSVFHSFLDKSDRATLDGWLAEIDGGKFASEIAAEEARRAEWSF